MNSIKILIELLSVLSLIMLNACESDDAKSSFCASKTYEVEFCKTGPKYIIIINEQECIACRQQFNSILERIDSLSTNKTIYWVFEDVRMIVANKIISEYTYEYHSLEPKIIVSPDLYSTLQIASGYTKRSNFIATDSNDNIIYCAFTDSTIELNASKSPVF